MWFSFSLSWIIFSWRRFSFSWTWFSFSLSWFTFSWRWFSFSCIWFSFSLSWFTFSWRWFSFSLGWFSFSWRWSSCDINRLFSCGSNNLSVKLIFSWNSFLILFLNENETFKIWFSDFLSSYSSCNSFLILFNVKIISEYLFSLYIFEIIFFNLLSLLLLFNFEIFYLYD